MSYSDIERATSSVWLNSHSHIGGLDRAYLSKIENGHAKPMLAPLERWAKALRLELWQIFCDVEEDAPEMETHMDDSRGSLSMAEPKHKSTDAA